MKEHVNVELLVCALPRAVNGDPAAVVNRDDLAVNHRVRRQLVTSRAARKTTEPDRVENDKNARRGSNLDAKRRSN